MDWATFVGMVGDDVRYQALLIATTGLLLAALLSWSARKLLARLAARTETELDDIVVAQLGGPIALSVAFTGFWFAIDRLQLPEPYPYVIRGILLSGVVVWWSTAAAHVITSFLEVLAKHQDELSIVKPRTLPLFDIIGKVVVYVGALYFFFLAWRVDLTAWVASAGILGIAVGFGAQETIANLIAGLSILSDGPFRIGDWLLLENGERGQVKEVGLRTTRMHTLDGVEIVVPNRMLSEAMVVNESGGLANQARIAIKIGVAYGSDIDKVREVLLSCPAKSQFVAETPAPAVQFVEFGDSSLNFRLLVWAHPGKRMNVLDELNTAVYKSLAAAKIEIPFPQRDLHVRSWDGRAGMPSRGEPPA